MDNTSDNIIQQEQDSRSQYQNADHWIVILLFSVSNVFLLVDKGLYWDDWVWTGNNFFDYLKFGQQLTGSIVPGIVMALFYMVSPLLGHIVEFFLLMIPSVLLQRILRELGVWRRYSLFVCSVFAVFPCIPAKYSLSTAAYVFYVMLFWLATFLLIKYRQNRNVLLKIAYCILYFISFYLNSLVLFYLLPLGVMFYLVNIETTITRSNMLVRFLVFIKRFPELFIVPVLFFIVRQISLSTNPVYLSGVYVVEGYNNITFSTLIIAPVNAARWFFEIVSIGWNSCLDFPRNPFAPIVILVLVGIILFKKNSFPKKKMDGAVIAPVMVLLLAAVTFSLGVVVYLAAGKGPITHIYSTRHSILIPLSVALFAVAFCLGFERKYKLTFPVVTICMAYLVIAFVFTGLDQGKAFFLDSIKRDSFVANITKSSIVRDNHVFIVDDQSRKGFAPIRYDFYDYSALFFRAFSDETRVAVTVGPDAQDDLSNAWKFKSELRYKIKNIPSYEPTHRIRIFENKIAGSDLGFWWAAKTLVLRILHPIEYSEYLSNAYGIDVVPISKDD